MNVALLTATLADEPALLGYMQALRADDPMPTQAVIGFAASQQAMQRLLADHSLGRIWLIVADGQSVGYVAMTFSFSLELGGKTAMIDELFVDRLYRRQGIAAEALWLLDAEARRLNVAAIFLEVGQSNDAACALYRQCGFENRKYQLLVKLIERGFDSMAEQKATNVTWHEGSVSRQERQRLLNQKGVTVWMTGLSASGKSTIACILEQMLLHRKKHAYRLDGDNVRMGLNKNLGFSAEDRTENIRRIGEVAKLFADSGAIAITSFISPYKKDRDAVRSSMKPGEFIEVYINVSLAEAEKRDPKGLYKKARAGQLKGFTGIDDPYEAPEKPELVIETESLKPDEAALKILTHLEQGGYLTA